MTCDHQIEWPSKVPSLASCVACCQLTSSKQLEKAITNPTSESTSTTYLNREFYGKLNQAQKAALIAHERAHQMLGMDYECECCADKLGGYLMRAWGWSADACAEAMGSIVNCQSSNFDGEPRDSGAGALVGANAAHAKVVSRGIESIGALTVKKQSTPITVVPHTTQLKQAKAAISSGLKRGSVPVKSKPKATKSTTLTAASGIDPGGPNVDNGGDIHGQLTPNPNGGSTGNPVKDAVNAAANGGNPISAFLASDIGKQVAAGLIVLTIAAFIFKG